MSELASPAQLRASFLRWALFCVPGVLLLGFLSSQVAGNVADNAWFASLHKPALYPPPATFGIVWSLLYVLMGLSLAIIAGARGARGRGLAIMAFLLQLVLNMAWSPLFFGAHQITAALAVLVALVLATLATILLFHKVRPVAAYLLLPYLAWLVFAGVLNWQFLAANPGADGRSGAVTRIAI